MKPGMQRDILVAFWFLFDEFEIGDDCSLPPPRAAQQPTPHATAADPPRRKSLKSDQSA
jgi:hypothetical protein